MLQIDPKMESLIVKHNFNREYFYFFVTNLELLLLMG
ncbi:hypothetical protein DFQ08_102381 [Winogradskyella arenosi]|uniref:Uncharacterized protein n=1 Tax=Winogradskyella arenosi TaxID=533325 RepID=A0A368ZI85_9FLAO|nr:hypothetical protein DFQ08_102381 [Winogradskyella arenosi]